MNSTLGKPDFLAHQEGDVVAVAVRDLEPGSIEGGYLRGSDSLALELRDQVPLGHKLALVDLDARQDVIEYGLRVGGFQRRRSPRQRSSCS